MVDVPIESLMEQKQTTTRKLVKGATKGNLEENKGPVYQAMETFEFIAKEIGVKTVKWDSIQVTKVF